MRSNLFKEFDSISEKNWKQQIQFDLGGKDYNSEVNWTSYEGVNIKPFFTAISMNPSFKEYPFSVCFHK